MTRITDIVDNRAAEGFCAEHGLSLLIERGDERNYVLEEGVADDSMGLFSGPALNEPTDPDCLESPSITFFLAELWDYCGEDLPTFDEEVRITCIHEFGHYLGLGESELEARGLL